MKSTRLFFLLFFAIVLLHAAAAHGASINMDDPRRALGREDDVRVDAQLVQDSISPGAPIGITYQIQNFTTSPVAVADKVSDASYDSDSGTITVSLGSEIPSGRLPHMVLIAPGEKKVLRGAAMVALNAAAIRTSMAGVPRYVQVKVTILRDLTPFLAMIQKQAQAPAVAQTLPDELFERWLESNDTIYLNALPVQWSPRARMSGADAAQSGM
ncbi:MAG: hypothetical protein JO197_16630 [Acidobacteria bacterium]|nr:hypothetical protein [Acidobacteriota bacterium]MBV9475429.1 hypothetical protein [Acidobacteriota bacterium]